MAQGIDRIANDLREAQVALQKRNLGVRNDVARLEKRVLGRVDKVYAGCNQLERRVIVFEERSI